MHKDSNNNSIWPQELDENVTKKLQRCEGIGALPSGVIVGDYGDDTLHYLMSYASEQRALEVAAFIAAISGAEDISWDLEKEEPYERPNQSAEIA